MAKKMNAEVTIEPLAVGYAAAGAMIGVGRTQAWKLARAGKLKTIKVGADDKVVVSSIREFVANELAKAAAGEAP